MSSLVECKNIYIINAKLKKKINVTKYSKENAINYSEKKPLTCQLTKKLCYRLVAVTLKNYLLYKNQMPSYYRKVFYITFI